MMLTIAPAASAQELDTVRMLLHEYQHAHGVDLAYQHFDTELRELPGLYAPPSGCLLLARSHGVPMGCAALRALGHRRAEMKRLYVREDGRHMGVGNALVVALIEQAHAIGYEEIVLDSLPFMHAAQRLYERLGFREIPPYATSPVAGTRYFGRRLDDPLFT